MSYEYKITRNIDYKKGVEKLIKDNLLISNYENAIECLLHSNRYVEALIIAFKQKNWAGLERVGNIYIENELDQDKELKRIMG